MAILLAILVTVHEQLACCANRDKPSRREIPEQEAVSTVEPDRYSDRRRTDAVQVGNTDHVDHRERGVAKAQGVLCDITQRFWNAVRPLVNLVEHD